MSTIGKQDDFVRDDLIAFARTGGIRKTKARHILAKVSAAVANWSSYAAEGGVP